MRLICFEEAIEWQRQVFSGWDRRTTSGGTQGHLQGSGAVSLERGPWMPCEGLQSSPGNRSAPRKEPQFGMEGLSSSPQAAPHQPCDLGRVTVSHEGSVFPLVKGGSEWGPWNSEAPFISLPLMCAVQHGDFQKTCETRPEPTNVRGSSCSPSPAASRPCFGTVHISLQMHVCPAVSSMWFVWKT